jgi:hypothetical protein
MRMQMEVLSCKKRKPMISVGFARVSKNTSRVEALAE